MIHITEVEIVINVIRPSGHKLNMHRWKLVVEDASATQQKLRNFVVMLGRITEEKAGFASA